MSAVPAAALLLAAGALTAPEPPIRRLRPRRDRRGDRRIPVAVAVLAVAAIVIRLSSPAVASVVAAMTAAAVARLRRRRRAIARRREAAAMAAALEVLIGELRVGAHPVRAFSIAAEESDGVVAQALKTIASRARLGADIGVGLRDLAAQSAVPAYWNRVEVCWNLAAQHGLAMAGMMRTALTDITERQRFEDRMRAGLAGARATAAILAVLPVLGVLLGQVIGARPLPFLFGAGSGRWLLVVGLALMCAGVAWSDRIIDRAAR